MRLAPLRRAPARLATRLATRFAAAFGPRPVARKPKKPPDIQYGVDDRPPLPAMLLSACQHVGNLSISIVVPVVILREANVSPQMAAGIISISFLGLALAAVLQALPRGPVGSGYLAPSAFSGLFIAPSAAAINLGGLSLMFGMTVFAGLVQALLSGLTRHLRPFLPPEVAGTVTFLLGTGGGIVGLHNLLAIGQPGPVPQAHWVVAAFTLVLIVGLNVWTRGLLRMCCVLIGLLAGYAASVLTGLLPLSLFTANPAPAFALPHPTHAGLSFDLTLALPFLIAAVVSSIKAIAAITACQRTNDANYIRPDLTSINRGVLADGLNTALAGVIGTAAFNVATSSVGMAAATGMTSRRVAVAIAGIMALLAFSPAAAVVFSSIPNAVSGAILLFSSCFVITSGVEIMASRLLDSRRMLVIASAILAAEGAQTVAASTTTWPAATQQIVASPLLLGTVVALLLNLVFRPGMRRNSVLLVDPAALDIEAVHGFMDARGAAWGARSDVIQRVSFALAELVETLVRACEPRGPIRIDTSFNEFRVSLRLIYHGTPMPFPTKRPGADEIADTEDGLLRLSGYLVRRQTDSVKATQRGDQCSIELSFDH